MEPLLVGHLIRIGALCHPAEAAWRLASEWAPMASGRELLDEHVQAVQDSV